MIIAIATLKILVKEQKAKLASNILIAVLGGVYGLGVDTVLWLVVQLAQYLSVPPFSSLIWYRCALNHNNSS